MNGWSKSRFMDCFKIFLYNLLISFFDQIVFDQTVFDQIVFDQIVFDQIVFDQIVFDQIVFDQIFSIKFRRVLLLKLKGEEAFWPESLSEECQRHLYLVLKYSFEIR